MICGKYTYKTLEDNTVEIIGFSDKQQESISLPSEIDGYSITRIGIFAFHNHTKLTSISIPKGVTSIEDYAFFGCTNLVSVTIPESVTSIGNGVFENCTNLASVTIPESVTSIGDNVFENCTNLASVTIPESVTSIGNNVFKNCTNLASVTIPESVTSIGPLAFSYCISLTSVTITSGVKSIGTHAFFRCTGLASIEFKRGVTSIGAHAFEGCDNLTKIALPDSVNTIGKMCFKNCQNLIEVSLSANVSIIDSETFCGCRKLSRIIVPHGIQEINSFAFEHCLNLQTIFLPNSIIYISDDAFMNCFALEYCETESSYASQYCIRHGIRCNHMLNEVKPPLSIKNLVVFNCNRRSIELNQINNASESPYHLAFSDDNGELRLSISLPGHEICVLTNSCKNKMHGSISIIENGTERLQQRCGDAILRPYLYGGDYHCCWLNAGDMLKICATATYTDLNLSFYIFKSAKDKWRRYVQEDPDFSSYIASTHPRFTLSYFRVCLTISATEGLINHQINELNIMGDDCPEMVDSLQ